MNNEYTNRCTRHLRRTHHYPKDIYSSYLTWRSANYPARNACSWEHHFPSRKNKTGWMRRSYRLKFRGMILVQPRTTRVCNRFTSRQQNARIFVQQLHPQSTIGVFMSRLSAENCILTSAYQQRAFNFTQTISRCGQ